MQDRTAEAPIVLVVEDNADNLLLVETVLRRARFRVLTAKRGAEALAHLRTTRPDVIVMDIQLPGEDGLSLTRRLKADPATVSIPIVALTAYATAADRARALAAGCDAYVSKPVDTRTLADQVRAVSGSTRRSSRHQRDHGSYTHTVPRSRLAAARTASR